MRAGRYWSRALNGACWVQPINHGRAYDVCDKCGKVLKRAISLTPEADGLEYLYGSECVKGLGLVPIDERTERP